MDAIEFTRNYSDLSTDRGFQFEFQCDRCGNGYKTTFQAWTMGTVSGALDAASSLFGGVFGQAANLGERARSATWQQARDKALVEAVNKSSRISCNVRNAPVGFAKRIAGIKHAAFAKIARPIWRSKFPPQQSAHDLRKFKEHWQWMPKMRYVNEEMLAAKVQASCPNCQAPLANECQVLSRMWGGNPGEKFCTNCGAKLAPGAKFCAECGTKQE